MRKYFALLILLAFSIQSCTKEDKSLQEDIVVAIYDGTPEMDYFIRLVEDRWEKAGHKEKLIFEPWDCYAELPDGKAALLCYDAQAYNALAKNGILAELDLDCGSDTFSWVLPSDDIKAVPYLLCANFLIYHKDDERLAEAKYFSDVNCEVAVPLKSMCYEFYVEGLQTLNRKTGMNWDQIENIDPKALAPVQTVYDNWLGTFDFSNASFSSYQGVERFEAGTCSAIYSFSETIYYLSDGDYAFSRLFPFEEHTDTYMSYADYLSIRKGISSNTESMCRELINIITSPDFQYDYIYHDGKPLYCMPASITAFRQLANKIPIYSTFYDYMSSDTNLISMGGPDYFAQRKSLKSKIPTLLR